MSLKLNVIAVVAGVAVFAGVSASAATLGGIKTDDLGANSNSVVSLVTSGASVTYSVAYDATLGYYKVTGVSVAPIGATESFGAGASIKLTLKGAAGVSLGEYTGTGIAGTGPTTGLVTLTPPGTAVAAADVIGASLVVNGGGVTALGSTNK